MQGLSSFICTISAAGSSRVWPYRSVCGAARSYVTALKYSAVTCARSSGAFRRLHAGVGDSLASELHARRPPRLPSLEGVPRGDKKPKQTAIVAVTGKGRIGGSHLKPQYALPPQLRYSLYHKKIKPQAIFTLTTKTVFQTSWIKRDRLWYFGIKCIVLH